MSTSFPEATTKKTTWRELLAEELKKPYMLELQEFLKGEKAAGVEVFPPEPLIYQALKQTAYDDVKVVIMGQDPYHGKGQAEGLSFSVQKGIKIPPSLQNIYKELQADLGLPIPNHGHLLKWAQQGVLLLNATLTVRRSQPKSHYGKGWEVFTDRVVEVLASRQKPLVFLLWGASAKEKCSRILNGIKHSHLVLSCPHPSPFSAYNGFFGSRHFSKTNEFLEKQGMAPIDWSVD
ncbi:MAG: uracil-DNA glycosylase [Waddliaceae bacterium]|nr:uracil-DNA glycosylase [Waddliaceae bacterium]